MRRSIRLFILTFKVFVNKNHPCDVEEAHRILWRLFLLHLASRQPDNLVTIVPTKQKKPMISSIKASYANGKNISTKFANDVDVMLHPSNPILNS